MNQTIFFADKQITFASSPLQFYDLTIDSRADTIAEISRAKVMNFFEKYNSILFLCNTPEEAYSDFCRSFRRIKAAGGVVKNSKGETLMILRNGRWDLPKGHLERGETLDQCAVREVQEECGIDQITLGEKIVETQHAYILNEEWAIKTTHWWAMTSDCTTTKGQSEEGIEEVAWCKADQLEANLKTSYPTIRLVIGATK
ncbi:MAG: NUDIX domain-containing protein [Rikenellaceae bacterium]